MKPNLLALLPTVGSTLTLNSYKELKPILDTNKLTAINYLRNARRALPNNNPLLKLMVAFPLGGEEPLEAWYRCQEIGMEVARSIGISTYASAGRPLPKCLIGQCVERLVLISGDYPEDNNWTEWQPIRLVSHSYATLEGRYLIKNELEFGEATITIDVGLLGLQWWYYNKANKLNEFPLSNSEFLSAFPVANSLHSFIEIALFNRLCYGWLGQDIMKSETNMGPYTLLNPDGRFSRYERELVNKIERYPLTLRDALSNILLGDRNAFQLLETLSGELVTKNNAWAAHLADHRVLTYMDLIWGLSEFKDNRRFLTNYVRHLERENAAGRFDGFGKEVTHILEGFLSSLTQS